MIIFSNFDINLIFMIFNHKIKLKLNILGYFNVRKQK